MPIRRQSLNTRRHFLFFKLSIITLLCIVYHLVSTLSEIFDYRYFFHVYLSSLIKRPNFFSAVTIRLVIPRISQPSYYIGAQLEARILPVLHRKTRGFITDTKGQSPGLLDVTLLCTVSQFCVRGATNGVERRSFRVMAVALHGAEDSHQNFPRRCSLSETGNSPDSPRPYHLQRTSNHLDQPGSHHVAQWAKHQDSQG